jgi:hypothetical protein
MDLSLSSSMEDEQELTRTDEHELTKARKATPDAMESGYLDEQHQRAQSALAEALLFAQVTALLARAYAHVCFRPSTQTDG